METKAAAIGPLPDLITGQTPAPRVERKSFAAPQPSTVESAADLRLIIERDEASGSYIYTTINRRTGEIVQRLPREDVLKMGEEGRYSSGRVIRTTA